MRFLTLIIILLVLLISGCDTDVDKSVTGNFVYTQPRGLKEVTVPPESLTVARTFKQKTGESSYTLAGRYETVEAYSVFRFPVHKVRRDNVIGAYVSFDIENTWREGEAEFSVYDTFVDWSDSTRLDPDLFLPGLGSPLATVGDTTTAITQLTFTIDHELVISWGDEGALLLMNSDAGSSMVRILSDDTNYPPILYLVKQIQSGIIDTSTVVCSDAAYFMNADVADGVPLLSSGDGAGYVLSIPLPNEIPPLATINSCLLTFTFSERILPDEPFYISVGSLTSPLDDPDNISKDSNTGTTLTVMESTVSQEIDIAPILNSWHIGGAVNHGIVLVPSASGTSPNQCIVTTADSLRITYTEFPDVK